MKLYFAPLSCSLATRIAIYEADLSAEFHQVVLSTKRTVGGEDYLLVNPKGQVPTLVTDEGLLTEGPAVLQYVADRNPAARLAPPAGTRERYLLQQWLNYISTEIHKGVYYLLFNPAVPNEAKQFARDSIPAKYRYLSEHLTGRSFLLDEFSVADAYLVTTLGWAQPGGVDLSAWPVLIKYADALRQRPAVQRALSEELALAGRG